MSPEFKQALKVFERAVTKEWVATHRGKDLEEVKTTAFAWAGLLKQIRAFVTLPTR